MLKGINAPVTRPLDESVSSTNQVNRYYSSVGLPTSLNVAVTASSGVDIVVNSISGLPLQYPYTLLIDWGKTTQEVITVLSPPFGTGPYTFYKGNIVRGEDNTTAQTHILGAPVAHGVSARDFTDLQTHMDPATSAVHGLGGAIVGTTDGQTLSNKTFTQPHVNDYTFSQHNHNDVPSGNTIAISVNAVAPTSGAGLAGVGQFNFKKKPTDQVDASATIRADNDLFITTVSANSTYLCYFWLKASTDTDNDGIEFTTTIPTGATFSWLVSGPNRAIQTGGDSGSNAEFSVLSTGASWGLWATNQQAGFGAGILKTGSNSGTFKLNHDSPFSANITLMAKSWMSLFRVA